MSRVKPNETDPSRSKGSTRRFTDLQMLRAVFSSKGEQSVHWQLSACLQGNPEPCYWPEGPRGHLPSAGPPKEHAQGPGGKESTLRAPRGRRAHSGPPGDSSLDPGGLDFDPTPREKCGQHTPVPPSGRQAMGRVSPRPRPGPWDFAPAATARPQTDVPGLLMATRTSTCLWVFGTGGTRATHSCSCVL